MTKHHNKRPPRSLSCDGKNRYSRAAAEEMARYHAGQDGSLMDAYKCSYGCLLEDGAPAWHIGHTVRSKHMK